MSVPPSVELGTVVPPQDPEDWRRPLTWVVALGLLAGPAAAAAWFVVAPPTAGDGPLLGTYLVGIALVAGAAAAGATQQGAWRSFATTIGAGLFGAVVTVMVGAAAGDPAPSGTISPTMAQALAAALSGLGGALVAATLAPLLSGRASRLRRWLSPALIGSASAALLVRALFSL